MIRSGAHALFEASVVRGAACARLATQADALRGLGRVAEAFGRAARDIAVAGERAGQTLAVAVQAVGAAMADATLGAEEEFEYQYSTTPDPDELQRILAGRYTEGQA